ncbi:hypothetical protein C8R34_11626 [Nitrosomonas sp. Nm84]|uniref:hypothetical protein n=1 Tax=Nitrosomonas sp. Nm84 TaxID=200124 RepID=UPI000D771267|nr:hypothetical protein [Nitrosomonas sp. Nm84]PXW86047.1 hypothetical protein C8R34_11626 [Nitrosomonas sp. Nm84]
MRLISKFLLITFITVILTGCALLKGTPDAPIDVDRVAERIEKNLANINDVQLDPSTKTENKIQITKETRDGRINSAFILINLRYQKFVNNSGLQHRAKTMASEFTQLSLNLAGTAVGGAGLKTLLAALSAGISGTNLAFEKTFIYESTVPALIMQMNADRAVIRNQILNRMQQGVADYTWEAAVNDLIEYYNAGTLQNAISSIKKNAGAIEKQMEENIVQIKNIATNDDVLLKRKLTQAILSNQNREKARGMFSSLSQQLSHLSDCKKLNSIASTVSAEDEKIALLDCIRATGSGSKTAANDLKEFQSILSSAGLISNQ